MRKWFLIFFLIGFNINVSAQSATLRYDTSLILTVSTGIDCCIKFSSKKILFKDSSYMLAYKSDYGDDVSTITIEIHNSKIKDTIQTGSFIHIYLNNTHWIVTHNQHKCNNEGIYTFELNKLWYPYLTKHALKYEITRISISNKGTYNHYELTPEQSAYFLKSIRALYSVTFPHFRW